MIKRRYKLNTRLWFTFKYVLEEKLKLKYQSPKQWLTVNAVSKETDEEIVYVGKYGEVEFVRAKGKTQILITSLFLVVRKWVSFAAYVYPYPPHD